LEQQNVITSDASSAADSCSSGAKAARSVLISAAARQSQLVAASGFRRQRRDMQQPELGLWLI